MVTEVVGTRRAISADDLFRLRWLSEPRIAPDGERAAVTITALDRERDRIVSQVAWLSTNGHGELQSESPTAGRDHDPNWAPDSRRLAFVSDRSGRDQVWVVDTGLRTARPLTESSTGATGPAWSPDARSHRVRRVGRASATAGRWLRRHAVPLEGGRRRHHRRPGQPARLDGAGGRRGGPTGHERRLG